GDRTGRIGLARAGDQVGDGVVLIGIGRAGGGRREGVLGEPRRRRRGDVAGRVRGRGGDRHRPVTENGGVDVAERDGAGARGRRRGPRHRRRAVRGRERDEVGRERGGRGRGVDGGGAGIPGVDG